MQSGGCTACTLQCHGATAQKKNENPTQRTKRSVLLGVAMLMIVNTTENYMYWMTTEGKVHVRTLNTYGNSYPAFSQAFVSGFHFNMELNTVLGTS